MSPMAGRSWASTESQRRSAWIGVAAFQIVVVGIENFYHPVHKGTVLGGLKGIGPENTYRCL